MTDWGELAGQAAATLSGTLVGGLISVAVVRWQTLKTISVQVELAAAQQRADARLAQAERAHERAAEAARQLLERLADFVAWLPSLPDVAEDSPRFSVHARDQCRIAMQSLRRGMHTDLLAIGSTEIRMRYRALVKLAYDVGWRGIGSQRRERQVRDVRSYTRYVQHSLEALIDGGELPVSVDPPELDRAGDVAWLPTELPWHWGDPADGS